MRISTILLAGLAAAAPLAAQRPQQPQQLPPTNQAVFSQLDMATPTDVRDAAGEPGPGYWQNRADYRISATLDTATHRVTGSETIHYTNNSPDALDFLWVQLDQNLFRPGSRGSLIYGGGARWRGTFQGGGYDLTKVAVARNGVTAPASYEIDGTRMKVMLETPLEPHGGMLDLQIDWTNIVPQYGADRTGRFHGADGWVYEVAQWYPRMYVYDDVHGWNPLPYLGQGEFYLEYGSFDVELTVPHDLIVVATGELQNADDVLTAEQRRRLDRARSSAETVTLIGPDEVRDPDTRPSGDGPLTWHFRADSVRDFTWAASRAFIWDAASWENVLIMSAYPREGLGDSDNPGWEHSTEYARHTISYYSTQWYRYPYPVAINVAGVVGGMEYPMIVFCGVQARGNGLFGVTDHELGHSWFPMIVGSDERRWAWMDEGFNTFINHYSNLDFYGPDARVRTRPDFIVMRERSGIADQPIMTHPDELRPAGLGFAAYRKPGYGLIMLREAVLGHDRFDAAFRAYIDRWAFKHPKPDDFFRSMEDVSGEDLDWFWRGWFMGTDLLDQAVDSVYTDTAGTHVALSNRQGLVMPTIVQLTYDDGSTSRVRLPVRVWATADSYVLEAGGRHVTGVQLDPDHIYPDVDHGNDVWPRERESTGGG